MNVWLMVVSSFGLSSVCVILDWLIDRLFGGLLGRFVASLFECFFVCVVNQVIV